MLDINNPDLIQNPYPTFASMRVLNKPILLPMNEDYLSKGLWLFSTYADATLIFKEAKSISKNLMLFKEKSAQSPLDLHLMNQDGSNHLRLRRLVADYFNSQASQNLASLIRTLCDQITQSFLNQKCADLVHDYAEVLPMQIIANIMGIPDSEFNLIRFWAKSIAVDSIKITDDIKKQRLISVYELTDYLNRLIKEGHFQDGHGLIGHLLLAEKDGGISRDEVIAMTIFLLLAGHETTIHLIGNAFYLLLSHPDQLALLKKNIELIPNAVEEVLRYESPVQRTTFRVTTSKIEFPNFTVDPGEQIAVLIGSANRDENVFPKADNFDIDRNPNSHLAFGAGLHNCLGKNLAKIEAEIAISTLVKQFSHAQLGLIAPVWKDSLLLRGLTGLPIFL